jgi:hypothetical protein
MRELLGFRKVQPRAQQPATPGLAAMAPASGRTPVETPAWETANEVAA